MIYLLDTNACISLLRPRSGDGVRKRIDGLDPAQVVVCSVVRMELLFGALRSRQRDHNSAQVRALLAQFASLPFDDDCADHAADIRAALTAAGALIGPADLLIAATARCRSGTLVTHNTDEFRRVPGLRIEDWEAAQA